MSRPFKEMKPIDRMSQKEALEMGLARYLPEGPCKAGHRSWRYTRTGNCCLCHTLAMRRNHAKNNHPLMMKLTVWVARKDAQGIRDAASESLSAIGIEDPDAEITDAILHKQKAAEIRAEIRAETEQRLRLEELDPKAVFNQRTEV